MRLPLFSKQKQSVKNKEYRKKVEILGSIRLTSHLAEFAGLGFQ